RVFDTLSQWIALDDAAIDAALRSVGQTDISQARRMRARRLFASALDTPGGLKVQTIHAFCTRLLRQFPFEANVAARFAVLDGRVEAELLDHATLEVLLEGAEAPHSAVGRALATAIAAAADTTFRDVIAETIRSRDAVAAWLDRAGRLDRAAAELSETLGIA